MPTIVALGEMLIDFAPVAADAAGYPTLKAQPGGAPCNFLAALQKYGCSTAMIGKVGDDRFGRLLIQTAADCGIETRGIIKDAAAFTTMAFVTLDADGNREFSFARKPGADTCLTEHEVDYSLIDACRVFHFGTLSLTDEPARTATQKAVAYAKAQGKLISFDPNLRKPLWPDDAAAAAQMEWGLHQADIVKISDEKWISCGTPLRRQRRKSCCGSTASALFMSPWAPGDAILPTAAAAARPPAPPVSMWWIPPEPGISSAAAP